jgi:hypothetical protein
VFFAHLYRAWPDPTFETTSLEYLDLAIDSADEANSLGLFRGLSGVVWAALELQRLGLPVDAGDLEDQVAPAINSAVRARPLAINTGLAEGIVGLGLLWLQSTRPVRAARGIDHVISALLADKTEDGQGTAWQLRGQDLGEDQATFPQGAVDLGLVRGMPGITAFLSDVLAERNLRPSTRAMASDALERGVGWMRRSRRPRGEDSLFSNVTDGRGDHGPSRLGWCYGDLCVGLAMLKAARALKRNDWQTEALGIFDAAASRSYESTGVIDAQFCHGSSGLAHLFNRIAHATGEERFRSTARAWIERTLDFRQPGSGVAGFLTRYPPPIDGVSDYPGSDWCASPGILEGAAGIGLVLLSAISPIEPDWDRLFLTNLPVGPP